MSKKEDVERITRELLQENGLDYGINYIFQPQKTAGEWVIHLTERIQLRCETDVSDEKIRHILRQQIESLS